MRWAQAKVHGGRSWQDPMGEHVQNLQVLGGAGASQSHDTPSWLALWTVPAILVDQPTGERRATVNTVVPVTPLRRLLHTLDCHTSRYGLRFFNCSITTRAREIKRQSAWMGQHIPTQDTPAWTVAATSELYGSPRRTTDRGRECAENRMTALSGLENRESAFNTRLATA